MLYGLYLSAQGADVAAFHQSVLANNLANANTTAFKRDTPVFRAHAAFDAVHMHPHETPESFELQTGGVSIEGTVTDFQPGPLKTTGHELDLAILGEKPAFFEVGAGDQVFLTRNGKFSVDPNGLLVMSDTLSGKSLPVLSVDGSPIEVPENSVSLEFSQDGLVTSIGPEKLRTALAELSLVEPDSPELLLKEGDSLYLNLGTAKLSETAQVRQGMLEESDVQPVTEMVDLIQSSRGFEMNMNLIRMQDETVAQLLQTIPRK